MILSYDQVVVSCSFLDACARAKIADVYAVIMLKHSFIKGDTAAFIAGVRNAHAKVSSSDSIPNFAEITQLLNQLGSEDETVDESVETIGCDQDIGGAA